MKSSRPATTAGLGGGWGVPIIPASLLVPSSSKQPKQQQYDATEEQQSQQDTTPIEQGIHDLARRLTIDSSCEPGQIFPSPANSALDYKSPKFDARAWVRAFYHVRKKALKGKAPTKAGIAFSNLSVYGFGTATDYQKTVGNWPLSLSNMAKLLLGGKDSHRVDILHNLEGVVREGEMVAVLGPPGSGCSTFLKTISGDTDGFHISQDAILNYQGIQAKQMATYFRGEAVYTAEVDHHFPHLTVGDTLYFAALARLPRHLPDGVSRHEYAEHLCEVTMKIFGISHTKNTRVGDDFVRGVSGGERKRVTIAEAALSYAPLQCWDNSTRGLDSANAIEFCKSLRIQADIMGITSFVAIYQAPQAAFDLFDKVLLLYQGRQIYFGKAADSKCYFENLGFYCPPQQTTPDFLTSMTSHSERIAKPGWETKVPRSPDEFALAWKQSQQRTVIIEEILAYRIAHPFDSSDLDEFAEARRLGQSASQRAKSPYTLSYIRQVLLNLQRAFVMLKTDPSLTLSMLITNLFEALIIGSIFYGLPQTTDSLDRRALFIFFVVIINAFASILEIMTLYAKRKVIEKHNRYSFYHPSSEALASIIMDLPYKVVNAIMINLILYFMANLRQEPGAFFTFLLFNFMTTISMSMLFRLIGSATKSIAQALAPASIILMCLVLYSGFVIPLQYMRSWIGWSHWANPIYYGFESLLSNEFSGRNFTCTNYVPDGPSYESVPPASRSCTVQGAIPGQLAVSGTDHIREAFGTDPSNKWRNLGILFAFMLGYLALHLLTTEYVASEKSKGEVLVFSRKAIGTAGLLPRSRRAVTDADGEQGAASSQKPVQQDEISSSEVVQHVEKQTSVFHWKDVCYDIEIKGEPRRILDHVGGWVKPGTLTALMGASGAGKTTLLDVLASRVTTGIVSGDMLVDGKPRDMSFQQKTGYVQQQDLHLSTATVREALEFSALLRQPATYSRKEKLDYVDTVIQLLNMQECSDAVIGIPGQGLNVEQRKRLTIGVELVARPQLLLFLDEPTSGLDSQTSWSICDLMEKLTKNGQAILCTIHQPSAMLFQRFDRLLLLSKGKTVYFGEIGKNSTTLLRYFTDNGAPECPTDVNPAEHMLRVVGAAGASVNDIDWPSTWRNSAEYREVEAALDNLVGKGIHNHDPDQSESGNADSNYRQFAAPATEQFRQVTWRVFQQYWRTPAYLYSKLFLAAGAALFIGLSFLNEESTQRGLRNQLFGVFIFLTIFPQLAEQMMPIFATQRSMYEARERPSKTYSWQAFLVANILVEIAWNSVISFFCFICWYYPIGLYRNSTWTNQVDIRGFTMFLQVWVFFVFTSTFATMMIAAIEHPDVASSIVNLFMIMMFAFCGVLAGPSTLPRFWIFMYRINPFTYVIEAFLGTSLANAPAQCEGNEYIEFMAPTGTTCGQYLSTFISTAGGFLADTNQTLCKYCPFSDTDQFLASINMSFANRWRNFGLLWAFCGFNILITLILYWLVRVPKKTREKGQKSA